MFLFYGRECEDLSFFQHIDFKLLMLCQRDTFLFCYFPGFLVMPHTKHVLLLTSAWRCENQMVMQYFNLLALFHSILFIKAHARLVATTLMIQLRLLLLLQMPLPQSCLLIWLFIHQPHVFKCAF